MASDLNRVILIGRLTRDPEIRYTQSGTGVANFSIATNRTYVQGGEKKELASFFNCVAWS
ncbi:MAG: single-stranded DNA-binding protein, partial [bacterium]|nr:single-stranded DNA-binding protein [bacterium]